jgi:hypothetical protein
MTSDIYCYTLSACKVQAFLFLVVPVVCLPASLQGCLEKNHPRFAPVFFSAKPCRDAGKQTTGTTRNKNACTLQADNV